MSTLDKLEIGQSARIKAVGGEGQRRQHFLDMGLIPDAFIKIVKYAPLGDPMEVMIHGYALTLRKADAALIEVEACDDSQNEEKDSNLDQLYITSLPDHNAHPGLGEEGIYHDKTHETPLPKGTKLTFALAGQQNCGKTTLFNQLTGANQHVATSLASPSTARTASSKDIPRPRSPTCRASTRCRLTPPRRSSRASSS